MFGSMKDAVKAAPQFMLVFQAMDKLMNSQGAQLFQTFLDAFFSYIEGEIDWEALVSVFQTLLNTFKEIAPLVGTVINPILEELNQFLIDNKDALKGVKDAIDSLNPVLKDFMDNLKDIEDAAAGLIGVASGSSSGGGLAFNPITGAGGLIGQAINIGHVAGWW